MGAGREGHLFYKDPLRGCPMLNLKAYPPFQVMRSFYAAFQKKDTRGPARLFSNG